MRRLWIVLLVLYAAAIVYVSHQPLAEGIAPFPHADKLLHACEFGVFLALAWLATGRRMGIAIVLALAFALSDEIHQAFVPTRDASGLDLLADAIGVAVACGLLHAGMPLWRRFRGRILGQETRRKGAK